MFCFYCITYVIPKISFKPGILRSRKCLFGRLFHRVWRINYPDWVAFCFGCDHSFAKNMNRFLSTSVFAMLLLLIATKGSAQFGNLKNKVKEKDRNDQRTGKIRAKTATGRRTPETNEAQDKAPMSKPNHPLVSAQRALKWWKSIFQASLLSRPLHGTLFERQLPLFQQCKRRI